MWKGELHKLRNEELEWMPKFSLSLNFPCKIIACNTKQKLWFFISPVFSALWIFICGLRYFFLIPEFSLFRQIYYQTLTGTIRKFLEKNSPKILTQLSNVPCSMLSRTQQLQTTHRLENEMRNYKVFEYF